MNFMSNSLRILLLIVFALFSCAFENVSSDSKLGNCLDYDLMRSPLLVKQTVHRPKNTIISQLYTTNWTVRFPENGEFYSPIRCILINARDEHDGFATVQSGGVNQRHVFIYFRSYYGRDINFSIEIFGDASKWWILFENTEIET